MTIFSRSVKYILQYFLRQIPFWLPVLYPTALKTHEMKSQTLNLIFKMFRGRHVPGNPLRFAHLVLVSSISLMNRTLSPKKKKKKKLPTDLRHMERIARDLDRKCLTASNVARAIFLCVKGS